MARPCSQDLKKYRERFADRDDESAFLIGWKPSTKVVPRRNAQNITGWNSTEEKRSNEGLDSESGLVSMMWYRVTFDQYHSELDISKTPPTDPQQSGRVAILE